MRKRSKVILISGILIVLAIVIPSTTMIILGGIDPNGDSGGYVLGIETDETYIYQLTKFDEDLATIYLEFNTSEIIFGVGVMEGWMYAIEIQNITYSETLETPLNTTMNGWKLDSLFWGWTNDSSDFTNSSLATNSMIYQFKNPSDIPVNISWQVIYQAQYYGFPCPIINYLGEMDDLHLLSNASYLLESGVHLITIDSVYGYEIHDAYYKFVYDYSDGLLSSVACYSKYQEVIWQIDRMD